MRFQIQNQRDLEFTNMWIRCCLILHNLILEIEECLGLKSTNELFMEEAEAWGVPQNDGHDDEHDDEHDDGHEFIGSPGQVFRNQLVERLFRTL